MNNKERFKSLVSKKDTQVLEDIKWREENRHWLKHSQKVALSLLKTLKEANLTIQDLAWKVGVEKEVVALWVKGSYNFTLMDLYLIDKFLTNPKDDEDVLYEKGNFITKESVRKSMEMTQKHLNK